MSAELKHVDEHHWALSGRLDFDAVASLWPELKQQLDTAPSTLTLSLGDVREANSATVALLLEATQLATQRGLTLKLEGIPEDVLALAGLCNAQQLIGN